MARYVYIYMYYFRHQFFVLDLSFFFFCRFLKRKKKSAALSQRGRVAWFERQEIARICLEGYVFLNFSCFSKLVKGTEKGNFSKARGYLVDPASGICLSQGLSHASVSISNFYDETANGSVKQL